MIAQALGEIDPGDLERSDDPSRPARRLHNRAAAHLRLAVV